MKTPESRSLIVEIDAGLAAAALRISSNADLTNRLTHAAKHFATEHHKIDGIGRRITNLVIQDGRKSDRSMFEEAQ